MYLRPGPPLVVLLLLWSCSPDLPSSPSDSGTEPDGDVGGDGDAGGDGDGDALIELRPIMGRTYSGDDLTPQGGIRLIAIEAEVVSDEDGRFAVEVPLERDVLDVGGDGFAPLRRRLPQRQREVNLHLVVQPVLAKRSLDLAAGAELLAVGGAMARIPADGLRSRDGGEKPSAASLEITPIDPGNPAQRRAFPGDFPVVRGGKRGILQASAAMDVTATAADDGRALDVAEGRMVEVRFPVSEPQPARERELFGFDPEQGAWLPEGQAQLTLDKAGHRVYAAKIQHLSWWAVGESIEDGSCVRACARMSDDSPAVGATVSISGVDHTGQTQVFADGAGCFAADVKADAEVEVVVEAGDERVRVGTVQTPGEPMQAEDDPELCASLGALVLAPRVDGAVCEAGREQCGDACVDPLSSAAHCGGCDVACAVAGQACVDGSCRCTQSQTLCGGGTLCTDTRVDPAHCGSCGNACGQAQVCEAGACVDLACPQGLTDCDGVCVDLGVDGVGGACPAPGGGPCPQGRTECGALCVDAQTDAQHCGACGQACANGEVCAGGRCAAPGGCEAGFMDCGAGCTDLRSDLANCGSCGNACSFVRAAATCESGACLLGVCDADFHDADGMAINGCEYPCVFAGAEICNGVDDDCDNIVDEGIAPQPTACGLGVCAATGMLSCVGGTLLDDCTAGAAQGDDSVCDAIDDDCDGMIDEAFVVGPTACGLGSCQAVGLSTCVAGSPMDDCTPGPPLAADDVSCDGVDDDCDDMVDEDVDTGSDVNNCGGCGVVCSSLNSTQSCVFGTCSPSCNSGWADCDGTPQNGCEQDTGTSITNCGGCGVACSELNAVQTCTSGICIPSCNAGWEDCDGNGTNGCETDVTSSVNNCGSCNSPCTNANGTQSCAAGTCIPTCNPGWDDCDGNGQNGCEQDTGTSLDNCGSCGTTCVLTNATEVCTGGSCLISTCDTNAWNCDGSDANGCETLASPGAAGGNDVSAYLLGTLDGTVVAVTGDTVGFSSSYTAIQLGCGAAENTNDALFEFDISAATNVTISATSTSFNYVISLFDDGDTPIDCATGGSLSFAAAPGIYRVAIAGLTIPDTGSYTLTFADALSCSQ